MKRKFLFTILTCFSLFTLSSCGEQINGAFSDIIDKIWPNVWVTLAQIIAFILMCLAVFFFTYKPIKKNLNARKDYVEKNIKDSKDQLEEAKNKNYQANENLSDSKQQAIDIINNAKTLAEKDKQDKLKETDDIIKQKYEAFEENIAKEKEKLAQDMHDQIVSTSIDISKSIIKKNMDEKENKKIIDEFLDGVEKK